MGQGTANSEPNYLQGSLSLVAFSLPLSDKSRVYNFTSRSERVRLLLGVTQGSEVCAHQYYI